MGFDERCEKVNGIKSNESQGRNLDWRRDDWEPGLRSGKSPGPRQDRVWSGGSAKGREHCVLEPLGEGQQGALLEQPEGWWDQRRSVRVRWDMGGGLRESGLGHGDLREWMCPKARRGPVSPSQSLVHVLQALSNQRLVRPHCHCVAAMVTLM